MPATQPDSVPSDLLEDVVELARLAGDATLRWFQSAGLEVDAKSDGTPVTIADRTAEQIIREELAVRHPDDRILGEEGGASGEGGVRRWIIDPIDGTLSFVHGVPLYATLVAVEDETGIAAGAIHHPALEETVWAGRGAGAFHNGSPCRVSSHDQVQGAVLSTSDFTAMPLPMLKAVHASPFLLRTWGDAYGYTLVATGRMEVMVDPIVSIWDVAPMAVIIPEAGGRLSSVSGRVAYDAGSAVGSNGVLHDRVLEILSA